MQKREGDARGAREGDDLLAERADPGDAELRGRAALLGGHGDERVDEELVVLHVLGGVGAWKVSRSGSLAEGELDAHLLLEAGELGEPVALCRWDGTVTSDTAREEKQQGSTDQAARPS